MKPKSETLIFQFSNHIDQLHTDQTRLLNYITELENLVEEYREFVSRSKLSAMDDMPTKLNLLAKTDKIVGPLASQPPEKEDPGVTQSGLYLFQVDKDEAEKKQRQGGPEQ